jgi:hypothetical protein
MLGAQNMKRTLTLTIVMINASLTLSCASLGSKLSGCDNDPIKEVRSPSGKMKAIIFERDCGATTSFTTQVSMFSANQALQNESGSVFVADTDHGIAPAGAWGGPLVELTWLDDAHVLLRYDKRAAVFKHEELVGNVNIRYETFAP